MFGRARQADRDYIRTINDQRRAKDRFFAASPESPIPFEHRHGHPGYPGHIAGLSYYPPDPAFRVEAEVVPFAHPEIVQIGTSTGEIRPQARSAELRFRIGGRDVRLFGFADPQEHHAHELFVPFRDATSGRETYGAGRYLEVEPYQQADGTYTATLDFNLAYNPYCAYSPNYSCPIPPKENTLPASITAGERSYTEGH
ncbi:MAG TPA: DUF1684 domain-containing protein [Ktedonobacterales bacterium]|nr:DUF1684 domain-containing protein [Ktedonobacterales bacterium]